MPLEILYYNDINLLEFKATIISIEKIDGLYYVVLDRTAFYPNSGGMNNDIGYIDDIEVVDVIKKDDNIIHILKSKPENKIVNCQVDSFTRFTNIQIHDAQHLLSALLEKRHNLITVSHHVHNNYCDLVLSGNILTDEMMFEIEKEANDIIINQTPLEIFSVYKSDLARFNIKDNPKYSDPVRITNIKGLDDYNACGCLHFDNLSKIQAIKYLGMEKEGKNFKIFFTAGLKMLEYFNVQNNVITNLKFNLKANENTIIDKVASLMEKNNELSKELIETKKIMFNNLLDNNIRNSDKLFTYQGNDINDIKLLAQEIINYDKKIIAYLQVVKENKYQFILVKQKDVNYSLEDLFATLKSKFDLNGGGKNLTINGQSSVDLLEIITEFIKY